MKLIDPQPMETLPESGEVFVQIGTVWAWREPIDVNDARIFAARNFKMVPHWSYHAVDDNGLVHVCGPAGSGGSGTATTKGGEDE